MKSIFDIFVLAIFFEGCAFATAQGPVNLEARNTASSSPDSPRFGPLSDFPNPSQPFQRKSSDWHQHLKLHGTLLAQYKRDLRPVHDDDTQTNVKFQLHVTHLEEVDEKQQTLTLNGWIFMSWTDEKLRWNHKSEFRDINVTRLPQVYIWTPDLVLFNNAKAKDTSLFGWSNWAAIFSNGTVLYDPQTRFTATCHFDYSLWPRDVQGCQLMFGSWVYRAKEISFSPLPFTHNIGPVLLWASYRRYGSSWHIIEANISNRTVQFPDHLYGPDSRWNMVMIDLTLVRNAGYADLFVVMPLCVAWFLCLLAFWTHGLIRAGLLITNLVMQLGHLLILVNVAPPVVSAKPKIFAAVELGLTLSAFAVLLFLISESMRNKPRSRPPPAWIAKLLSTSCCRHVFKWFLCLQSEEVVQEYSIQLVDGNDGTDSSMSQVEKPRVASTDWLRVSHCFDFLAFVMYSAVFSITYADAFGPWMLRQAE